MNEVTIRTATIEDVPRLLELEQGIIESERPYDSFIKENITYYDIESLISSNESTVSVAVNANSVFGCGYAQIRESRACHTHTSHCYLGFIYLERYARGMGVGLKIIDALKSWGESHGLKHFQLDVYSDNRSAIRAYEKAGFKKITVKMELVE